MAVAPGASSRCIPDWSQQTEQIFCPLCDYNLRGLTEPLCPECGYTFDWPKLLDPAQRLHPYLFEHHPERNVRSFLRTLAGAALPRKFWTSLHPAQPSHPGRLALYWFVLTLLSVALCGLVICGELDDFNRHVIATRNQAARAAMALSIGPRRGDYGSREWLDRVYPLPPSSRFFTNAWNQRGSIYFTTILGSMWCLWPVVTGGILLMFQQSMRRTKIKTAHVMRCAIYSGDAAPILVMLCAAIGFGVAWWLLRWPVSPFRSGAAAVLLWALILISWSLATWRLKRACKLYLRFPHTTAVVVCSQVIYALLWMCMALWTMPYNVSRSLLG